MITISKNLQLKKIVSENSEVLFELMQAIYPPAYQHFWTDNGNWYINTQYSKENILQELSEKNTDYYFVVFNDEIVGNFRIIWGEKLANLSEEKQVKLHRIYLHPKTQGKGLGKKLLFWLEEKVKEKGFKIIWLDGMNKQPQAFQFYEKLGYIYHSHTFLPFENMLEEYKKMSQLYKKLNYSLDSTFTNQRIK
ncbi:GNAT family N-acetyltransferase [Polaribacter aestuariivivens]|uniref:GNAT family N-acetyltransferase n=1 Tax=Polaribacter aestuariivivens TaxID=2304626 RepID=A0A5S3N784_9FLAO|nr:GNAT family N-acetyltransferase [Polaribacter aestuariivivens]TMM30394.1 GNAT family N-acetyltransferase [Polaribacter aestuariivivens]